MYPFVPPISWQVLEGKSSGHWGLIICSGFLVVSVKALDETPFAVATIEMSFPLPALKAVPELLTNIELPVVDERLTFVEPAVIDHVVELPPEDERVMEVAYPLGFCPLNHHTVFGPLITGFTFTAAS